MGIIAFKETQIPYSSRARGGDGGDENFCPPVQTPQERCRSPALLLSPRGDGHGMGTEGPCPKENLP